MKGQSIIELLIAMGVFIISFSGIVFLILESYASGLLAQEMNIANFLAKEGIEAAKSIRDNSWNNLAIGEHGLATSADGWVFQGSEENFSNYLNQGKRKIIVQSIDPNKKAVISSVAWSFSKQRPEKIELITYLTNWLSAIVNWSHPFQESGLDLSGAQNGLKIQTKNNYSYIIRNGGTLDFSVLDVTDTANPILVSSLDILDIPRNISITGNYAYISSSNNNGEFQIIDLSDPSSPVILGTYNASGSADANGVAARWPLVYLLRSSSAENEFLILDVSIPANVSLLGSLNLNDSANEVVVLGDYAFVASSRDTQELQVVNIASPSSPFLASSYNISGNTNALAIAGFDNTVVLGRANLLYIFDVSLPSSPVLLGSFNAGGVINDISLGNNNNYVFLGTDSNNAEFQVVDISIPGSPTLIGFFDSVQNNDINGVAYNELKDRVFVASESGNQEFIVIAP